jgi:hypothetical protein
MLIVYNFVFREVVHELRLLFCKSKSEIHLSCGTYFLGPTKVQISDFLEILYLPFSVPQ